MIYLADKTSIELQVYICPLNGEPADEPVKFHCFMTFTLYNKNEDIVIYSRIFDSGTLYENINLFAEHIPEWTQEDYRELFDKPRVFFSKKSYETYKVKELFLKKCQPYFNLYDKDTTYCRDYIHEFILR
jgi:hypothetical protein